MATTIDLSYPHVMDHLKPQMAKGRTELRAFLAWFLEHYYHLDPDDATDCVCDGTSDKGIDGIFVDVNLETIDVFQSKLFKKSGKTLGDTDLKEFSGTVSQLSDPKSIAIVAKSTTNKELQNLLQSEEVASKVQQGFQVRGVFTTNVPANTDATAYLSTQNNLQLYDQDRLTDLFVPFGPSGPIDQSITLHTEKGGCAIFQINGVRAIVASFLAKELVTLGGIASGALFAWNVRQSLGRTKVNKEIGTSILDMGEHKNFRLYHNGLTVLSRTVTVLPDAITINHYAVVNGCQSLTTLHEHRTKLSDSLKVLVRVIEVSPDSEFAQKITHHSNNQNAISARDLQSNSSLQRRLQKEFEKEFPKEYGYRIKRGEVLSPPEIIDNPEAARALLAFDLQEPWSCHQTGKLFDDLHLKIFGRPEVNAHRIVALHQAYLAVEDSIAGVDDSLMARYNLTKFFLLHLLRAALNIDHTGKAFCKDPAPFVKEQFGPIRIKQTLTSILKDLIIDLNAEIKERREVGNPVDYKRELKSQTAVKLLERNIMPNYQKAVLRKRAGSFDEEWPKTVPGKGAPA